MDRIGRARKRYVLLKNINCVGCMYIDAVAVDIYSNRQKSLGNGGALLFIKSDLIFTHTPNSSK
jgi:hypothetical protein